MSGTCSLELPDVDFNLSMMSFEQLTASPAIAHHTEYSRTVGSVSSTPSVTAVIQPCRPNGMQAKENSKWEYATGITLAGDHNPAKPLKTDE